MRILLVGDYSMVHKNLKEGLEQLEHTVTLVSDGDGWKKLPGYDLPLIPEPHLPSEHPNKVIRCFFKLIRMIVEPAVLAGYYRRIFQKGEFDIVHMMSADLFEYWERKRVYKIFFSLSHKRLFVSIPGEDCYTYELWKKGLLRISWFDDPEYLKRFNGASLKSKVENSAYRYTIERAKALIPVNPYETEIPFEGMKNLRKAIPLPLNPASVEYTDNVPAGPVKIYHGISYRGRKGSDFILKALEMIKEKYGNRVEIITTDRLPYEDFLSVLQNCNIYVDQCRSYTYGMAAVISMAMGKAVLSGKEPETVPSLEGYDCPIINIIPDAEQIAGELEKLLEDPTQLLEIGRRGRIFVEELHDCRMVAERYLKEWAKEE